MKVGHVLPWICLRQGRAARKKLRPGHRTEAHRRIPQDVVNAMRADYVDAPKGKTGRLKPGALKTILSKFGLATGQKGYWSKVIRGELRDNEREVGA